MPIPIQTGPREPKYPGPFSSGLAASTYRTFAGTSLVVQAYALYNTGLPYVVTVRGMLFESGKGSSTVLRDAFTVTGAAGTSIATRTYPLADGWIEYLTVTGDAKANIFIVHGITAASPVLLQLASGFLPLSAPPPHLWERMATEGLSYLYYNANAGQPSLSTWPLPNVRWHLWTIAFTVTTAAGGANRRAYALVQDVAGIGLAYKSYPAEYLQAGGAARRYYFASRGYAKASPLSAATGIIFEELPDTWLVRGQASELFLGIDGIAAGDTLTDVVIDGELY
jgi:hypothetical protein